MKKILLLCAVSIISVFASVPDSVLNKPKTPVIISKLNDKINIDGKIAKEEWSGFQPISDFIQHNPDEGKPPTQRTEVYLCYDNEYIYIAAKMFDTNPDSITANLVRRDDNGNSDYFALGLDSYHDKRSGYFFGVNAAGTLFDGVLYNDSWDDDSWDGVWEAKVARDEYGWSCEIKIPFSQLRFHEEEKMIWGINFKRVIARRNESDYLVFIPKTESGFVSHFTDLHGLENIKSSDNLEILPYINSRAEYINHSSNDPFNDGSKYFIGAGADIKYGLGSNLTLNATINPDFGQVEVDPAVVNLSDVETYFDEKRPFFIEGSSIFNFGRGGARNYWNFNWWNPSFFYSRRIGRTPQGSIPDNDYVDLPFGTHILGAAKISGKIGDNWNIGSIQSLTRREFAEIQLDGKKSESEIEPLTYYGIFRGQKEFNLGNQGLGFIGTVTSRVFKDARLKDEVNKDAFTGGVDGWVFLDSSKTWVFAGWGGFSTVKGSKERILDLQKSSLHYFQRPDADYIEIDSSATSLNGYAMRLVLNKQKGNFFFNSAFGVISPGFDINDLGFMGMTNVINMHVGAGYTWTEPGNILRNAELGGAVFRNYDFGGNILWHGIFNFGYVEFLNYYWINWNLAYNPSGTYSNRQTRGGPLVKNRGGYQISLNSGSDSRKNWIVELGGYLYKGEKSYNYSISPELEIRPATNIYISISPGFEFNKEEAQYITTIDDERALNTFGKRYVFAELDQNTFYAGIRLNWTFTPNLSLQIYLQPLISSGKFSKYKELAKPKSYDYNIYGEGNSTFDEDNFIVDPDGSGPAPSFEFDNPNFNFKSLRGNAVLRWEYLPGSTIYLVWTQSRSHFEDIGEFRFNKSFKYLIDSRPDNIFMVKVTYWFNM